jgi:hypothetical protein
MRAVDGARSRAGGAADPGAPAGGRKKTTGPAAARSAQAERQVPRKALECVSAFAVTVQSEQGSGSLVELPVQAQGEVSRGVLACGFRPC